VVAGGFFKLVSAKRQRGRNLGAQRAKSYVGRKRGSHIWEVGGAPGVGSGWAGISRGVGCVILTAPRIRLGLFRRWVEGWVVPKPLVQIIDIVVYVAESESYSVGSKGLLLVTLETAKSLS
jgi:hypothetical protein